MSRSKPNRASKSKKNIAFPLLCGMFALSFVVMVVALIAMVHTASAPQPTFTPPPFEANAVAGTPTDVPAELGYTEHYKTGMAYAVSTCTLVQTEGQDAVVYFTSNAQNEKYVKLRVYDADGNVLGETGLLRAGEYVRAVRLCREVGADEVLTLKVMGYEPDTYQSAGAVRITVPTVCGT